MELKVRYAVERGVKGCKGVDYGGGVSHIFEQPIVYIGNRYLL